MSDRSVTIQYCNDGRKFVQVNCVNMQNGGVENLCNQSCKQGHEISSEQCNGCKDFLSPYTEKNRKRSSQTSAAAEPSATVSEHSYIDKIKSWAKAEISGVVEGKLDDEAYGLRIATCKACSAFEPVTVGNGVGWCKDCGCGRTLMAQMSPKARLPKATCPKSPWDKYA